MFAFIRKLMSSQPAQLLCPHCEEPMVEGHDVDRCARKRMGRRFFFQVLGGAAASVAVAAVLPEVLLPEMPVSGIAIAHGNQILTTEMITAEVLRVLQNNMVAARRISQEFEGAFVVSGVKGGDAIRIRKPRRFRMEESYASVS